MMSVKKRILLMGMFYLFNIVFSFLCLWVGTKGLLHTLRFEWRRLLQIAVMFLVISFGEMSIVMHCYHRRRNAFGMECIPLDFGSMRLMIAVIIFYVTSFVFSFFGSPAWIIVYMYMYAAVIVGALLLFGTGRFLWIDGEQRKVVNERGEVYLMKTFAVSGKYCVLGYINYRKKECRMKVKQNKRMKAFLKKKT